ncbi:hypothetical protein [Legionella santicrucis]|uniref:hypothetical protein n=1 Tax=Legionella santicrucis TaxID=45074 RepID=UPI000730B4F4|nr:hypothetical protein [Legionella santicrucis]
MSNTLKKKWNNFFPSDVELFKPIKKVASANNCAYFLIGAKARDILLEYFLVPHFKISDNYYSTKDG